MLVLKGMKFLSNFDTDIDTILLQHALNEYDKEHVLLIKKHPVFLVQSLGRYTIILLATIVLMYILATTGSSNETISILLIVMLAILICYWFYATISRYYKYSFYFHTTINAAYDLQSPGTKKLDTFIRHSLRLIAGYILVFILFEIKQIFIEINVSLRVNVVGGACLCAIIIALYKLIFIHIRYELDFLLVTPDYIEHIFQKNFFSRTQRTIKAQQVRTIELSQDGIIHGLFHLGKATFVTDALDETKDIYLTFNGISKAGEVKQKILALLKK